MDLTSIDRDSDHGSEFSSNPSLPDYTKQPVPQGYSINDERWGKDWQKVPVDAAKEFPPCVQCYEVNLKAAKQQYCTGGYPCAQCINSLSYREAEEKCIHDVSTTGSNQHGIRHEETELSEDHEKEGTREGEDREEGEASGSGGGIKDDEEGNEEGKDGKDGDKNAGQGKSVQR